jgi:hypothetical protein
LARGNSGFSLYVLAIASASATALLTGVAAAAAISSLAFNYPQQVLAPVSDVVADGPVPDELRQNMEAWVGCLAGALAIEDYQRLLEEAGFEDVSIEITRRYTVAEAGLDATTLPDGWEAGDGKLASAFVRATRPLAATSAQTGEQRNTTPVALVSRAEAKPTPPTGCC